MEVLAAAVAAIGGIWGIWYKRRLERRDQPPRAIHAQNRINEELANLRHRLGAVRCVLVKTHNGGGIPSAKTPLYTSALYEATTAHPLHDFWQGISVDAEMSEHLSRLMQEHTVEVNVDDLTPGSTMVKLYASDDQQLAKTVHKHYLSHDRKNIYYLSIQWQDARHIPSNFEQLVTERTINEIRELLA